MNIKLTCLAAIITIFSVTVNSQSINSDAHIHFNWDQAEIISPEEVLEKLKRAGIQKTILSSTPSHLALELASKDPNRFIPFFSPYIHPLGKRDWFNKAEVIHEAKKGLQQGLYQGIGEIHFMAGFKPKTDNKIFLQLMQLAQEYEVPVLIHVDAGNQAMFSAVCRKHSKVKILWAHAGGNLHPEHINAVLEKCPKVWIDLSARDPWRYGGISLENGLLKPGWKDLILKWPHRFLIGTDPVWKVTRTQSWDQPDDGWDHFEQLLAFHQNWLKQLPRDIQILLGSKNMQKLLSKP